MQAARETLCRDYWYPVYAYVRRLGHQEFDAEDLTQDFFAHILNKPWFEKADRERGRFRSFLLASLDNFIRDVLGGRRTARRGGAHQHIPLDLADARSRYAQSNLIDSNPAQAYENQWAMTVVDAAWRRIESEHAGAKLLWFTELKTFLTIEGSAAGYDLAAARLNTTVENIKVCVHRLRRRYGTILREEVARTLVDPRDVAGEMQHLRETFAERVNAAA